MDALRRLRPELLPFEIALFVAIFVADAKGLIPVSKTPLLLLIAWGSLRLRGLRASEVGLAFPPGWPRLAAIGVAWGVGMWLLEFFFTMPMLRRVLGYWPDLTGFNDLVGNLPLLGIYLAFNWVLAAFGEEMVWRGYALPRAAEFLGCGKRAWIFALVVVNTAFGLAHLYQGPSGVIQNVVAGVLLGVLYLVTRRNLVAPMIAHGLGNSIDLVVMYLGLYPAVGN